jgi:hypothetical protein
MMRTYTCTHIGQGEFTTVSDVLSLGLRRAGREIGVVSRFAAPLHCWLGNRKWHPTFSMWTPPLWWIGNSQDSGMLPNKTLNGLQGRTMNQVVLTKEEER